MGFDAGVEPLLVWRTNLEGPSGQTCTLSVYAGDEERCRLPVPDGAVHFAVSGDINGDAHFQIDAARTEAAQREAEKGGDALTEWLRAEAEQAAAAANSGGGGGCCLIA